MAGEISPSFSVLFAQVRKAGPTHGMDIDGMLRINSHPSVNSTIYLGDVAQTLLKVLQGHSTPTVVEGPKFDEQRWKIKTVSGDLDVEIESLPYWGFGLVTSCYLNKISLSGPLSERCKLVFDLVAALPHKPWEFARRGKFNRKVSSIKGNAEIWKEHVDKARDNLNELIEMTLLEKGDSNEIEIARNALADDNAPAVMRALSRMEADSIDIEAEDVSPDGEILTFAEDIPFVDLSSNEEE